MLKDMSSQDITWHRSVFTVDAGTEESGDGSTCVRSSCCRCSICAGEMNHGCGNDGSDALFAGKTLCILDVSKKIWRRARLLVLPALNRQQFKFPGDVTKVYCRMQCTVNGKDDYHNLYLA